MSNTTMNDELNNNSFFTEGKRDETIDLASLIKEKKTTPNGDGTSQINQKPASPLEQMKEHQASQTTGAIVNNDDLKEKKELKNIVMNDDRLSDFDKRVEELDSTIEKRKKIVVIKPIQSQVDYMQLMMEIDSVTIDSNGNASIDYKDANGNPRQPSYIRLRTESDPDFDEDADKQLMLEYTQKSKENKSDADDSSDNINDDSASNEKINSIVKVLIDKTGLGTDFMFSEEEKQKMYESSEIHVHEVKSLDINTIKAKRSERSFQETISDYQLSNSQTTICFPASGFRADMKGLTYGEMGDISLTMSGVTVDKYYKRLSVIYNKMTNISTGPFKSFEDFLKGFAFVDIPMALYGLYVSTQPEIQQIQLRDGECRKLFNHEYTTRSVLRLEQCSQTFLEKMKEIATSPASEYDNIRKNSAVLNSKFYELPYSKIVVEMGIPSAYEFLYNVIPLLEEKGIENAFPNDVNNIYEDNSLLLTAVRSIYIPNPSDGTYTVCEGYKDILDAIYIIKPEEIKILTTLTNKLTGEYQVTFSFGDIKCPHCGNITKNLEVTMDDLVFRTYQQLLSTEINVENIQGF